MAKNPFSLKTGGGILKKVAGVVIVLAALALVINHPHDAAGMVTSATDKGGGIIDSVAKFFRDLSNG
ncbi:hypothetical protein [Amycolatopsis sp. DSM 110486]|uniref:hypothetical protein n=1 Tax=Amycolatopsis sp. DSM 110486 TaxID=2865832 RepID=UPI001C69480F|nr:hypothetical protein [Amycolatopsis sp. DSM 110486]QYN23134.1 hypothetical protein K1T34_12145 [Amycolatopsis sp. DSM 110486]